MGKSDSLLDKLVKLSIIAVNFAHTLQAIQQLQLQLHWAA